MKFSDLKVGMRIREKKYPEQTVLEITAIGKKKFLAMYNKEEAVIHRSYLNRFEEVPDEV